MTAVSFNPYSWDNSSKAIQSSVTSLELKSGEANINVSNLEDDVVMVIPIASKPKNNTNASEEKEHLFLKPNKMAVHSYYAELADVSVTIEMGVEGNNNRDIVVEMFIKFGTRPSVNDFDHNFTISFKNTFEIPKEGNQTSCSLSKKHSVAVVPTKPGRLFVGVRGRNFTEHSRERRSCFGHGRQKRGCVGFKDPPPKGVFETLVPKYDPSTDVNYTMSLTQTSCLYWSEDKDKWISDGCKVIYILILVKCAKEFLVLFNNAICQKDYSIQTPFFDHS